MGYDEDRTIQEMSRLIKGMPSRGSAKQSVNKSRLNTEPQSVNPEHRLKSSYMATPLLDSHKPSRPVTEGAQPRQNYDHTVAKSRAWSLPFIDQTDSLDRLAVECQLRKPFPHDRNPQHPQ